MMKGGKPAPAIFFNVYKQENVSENGPTHTWQNFNLKEDIVIPAGTYDLTFFPSSPRNPQQGNLKIEHPKGDPKKNFAQKPQYDRYVKV